MPVLVESSAKDRCSPSTYINKYRRTSYRPADMHDEWVP